MNYLTSKNAVYSFDKEIPPALRIKSGDRVTFRTGDVVERELSLLTKSKEEIGDTLLECIGPVFVEGALPGDTLAIHIEEIKLADRGIVVIKPGLGLLGSEVQKPEYKITPVFNDYVQFTEDIKIPLRPMVGIIGTTPAVSGIPCVFPGTHGGNLDSLEVTTGNTLFLPVFSPGGLVSVGDLHSVMGDGEVCLTAIETQGTVTLQFEILQGRTIRNPRLETDTDLLMIASAESIEQALRDAVKDMIEVLQDSRGLSRNEALMLVSICGDAKISQVVNPLSTVKVSMPKNIVFRET
ncbi:MAG: hypothetical protein VR72_08475 [Clostridiaceae bacterium BRH_c20a]|nr:MAG: hypothetical protein VR72_08475 [Clostridiaceae bacterium BRH_c20a]